MKTAESGTNKPVESKPRQDGQPSDIDSDSELKIGSIEPGNGHSTLNRRKGLIRQSVASTIAAFSYFIIGSSLGWASPVLHYIETYHKPANFTHIDSTLMVSLFYAGNVVMPVPSGRLSDWVGRKASLLWATILPLVSWIFIWVEVPILMIHIARFLMGMYTGLALTVLPLYLGEIADPKVRGKIASVLQLFTNIGCVFAYIIGAQVSYRTFAIILGVVPIVHFFLVLLIPESPYWLMHKGKNHEASKSLAWLRGGRVGHQGIEEEASHILHIVNLDLVKPHNFKLLFTTKSYKKAMIIVEVISASQRFSGISAIMAYVSITVPEMPEFGLTANVCAIITGCANIIGGLIALPLVDRLGRLPLMMASCVGCGLSMLGATVWYYINEPEIQEGSHKWIPLTVFFMYGLCMNIGLGPIPTLMQGEMFPHHLKGKASAITVMVLAASSIVVNFTYIPIADSAGFWCNFLIYTVTCVACLVFTWACAFETKGKTLYEIQQHLAHEPHHCSNFHRKAKN